MLEFRHSGKFNFRMLSKGAAFFDRAAETVSDNVEGCKVAKRRSEAACRRVVEGAGSRKEMMATQTIESGWMTGGATPVDAETRALFGLGPMGNTRIGARLTSLERVA